MTLKWLFVVVSIVGSGCTSPEATRQRSGGPGADPGNRPSQVLMHEGSQQYWDTPVLIPTAAPSLAASQQARQLSLPSRDAADQTAGLGSHEGSR